jgi:hypothetical protein
VNVGGGMSLEGTFTAPLDGVYAFSFFFDEYGAVAGDTFVKIRVDGKSVADVFVPQDSNASAGDTFVALLTKGQRVDAFLISGATGENADTHFAGHLIFPL